jgi:hypothetical protein
MKAIQDTQVLAENQAKRLSIIDFQNETLTRGSIYGPFNLKARYLGAGSDHKFDLALQNTTWCIMRSE